MLSLSIHFFHWERFVPVFTYTIMGLSQSRFLFTPTKNSPLSEFLYITSSFIYTFHNFEKSNKNKIQPFFLNYNPLNQNV